MSETSLKEQELLKLLKVKKITSNVVKEIEKFLKNNILDFNVILPSGYNLLHHFIKSENPDLVNLIFEEHQSGSIKPDPNIETNDSKKEIYLSPLEYAIQEICDLNSLNKIIKILVRNGADFKKGNEDKKNLLHLASEKGNMELVSYCLEKDPTIINTVSKYGTALHLAVSCDHTDLVEEILNMTEIDLKLVDYSNNSALLLSVAVKNFNCYKLIYDFIIKSTMSKEDKKNLFNQTNLEGNTILHELAYAQSEVILNMTLKLDSAFCVDVNSKNNSNFTYKDIQADIVRLMKEKEDNEIKRKELLRQEKIKLLEEQRAYDEKIRAEREAEKQKELASLQRSEKLYSHRGKILIIFSILFMVVLYFSISNAMNKKKQPIII